MGPAQTVLGVESHGRLLSASNPTRRPIPRTLRTILSKASPPHSPQLPRRRRRRVRLLAPALSTRPVGPEGRLLRAFLGRNPSRRRVLAVGLVSGRE